MLFYFVRHGQTEANLKGLLAGGGVDIPLTELGHTQARELASRVVSAIGHPVHRVFASDMIRARQTGEYMALALGLPLEIEPAFREWHIGEWENEPFTKFGHLLIGEGEPQIGGESRKAFYGRVDQAWKKHHRDEEPYVIVSHGAVWLAMQDLLKIPRFKVENCQLLKVWSAAGEWHAEVK